MLKWRLVIVPNLLVLLFGFEYNILLSLNYYHYTSLSKTIFIKFFVMHGNSPEFISPSFPWVCDLPSQLSLSAKDLFCIQ